MSQVASQDRGWGQKAMFHSEFLHLGNLLEAHLDRIPEGEFKSFGRLAVAVLKIAFLDAEAEVQKHPDRLGYRQQELLLPPRGKDSIDMIDLHCQVLGIDTGFLRDTSSSILDLVADRARSKQPAPLARVTSITDAYVHRDARALVQSLTFLVQSGRFAGQYALAI